jgi:hypothetical protein
MLCWVPKGLEFGTKTNLFLLNGIFCLDSLLLQTYSSEENRQAIFEEKYGINVKLHNVAKKQTPHNSIFSVFFIYCQRMIVATAGINIA